MNIETLKDILVGGYYIDSKSWTTAISSLSKNLNEDEKIDAVLNNLIENKSLSFQIFSQATAEYYKLPFFDIHNHKPNEDIIKKLPENVAKEYHAVLVIKDDNKLTIATDNVSKVEEIKKIALSLFPKSEIKIVYALKKLIDDLLETYKNALSTRFNEIIQSGNHVAPEIINQIIEDALSLRASDIHIEPEEEEVIVRFRIDGLLSEAGRLPKKYYENILNKIKVEGTLRIDEHNSAQDGSMRFMKDDKKADLRISILPTIFGEKVVLRILSYYVGSFALNELGLSPDNQKTLENISKKPFGMILVTGPTGSGKTTTLYAALKHINNKNINITTIEDPVEYRIVGINQVQVNNKTNLTFAEGLRSIVRQDPDVILVGEIRDKETAEIAVNAALTGHLLFSTFHANDAVTVIPRLLDMGIESFLLSSTLEAVVAQRLVRRICQNCIHSEELNTPILGIKTIYKGLGCDVCNYSGYQGQIGVFEVMPITNEIKDAIINNPDKNSIEKIARLQGVQSMFDDGIDKVRQGLTTFEEIIRVIGEKDTSKNK